jgi:fatty acid desaturase
LDISNAFDKVCHNKLIIASLQRSGIPYYFIAVITNWHAKLSAVVRALSNIIAVKSGVRQGGVLSPSIFNVFIIILLFYVCVCFLFCFYVAFLVQFCCCYTILLIICYHIIGEIKIDIY